MEKIKYNSGNYDKYNSKNPLKRWMIDRLNTKIFGGGVFCEFVRKYRNNAAPVRILDAGCGEGFISNLMYEKIENAEIVGLEYTSEALDIARKQNGKITYIQGDICNMPFEKVSFDVVVCMEVLEHLREPEKALRELQRVCRGLLVISVPNEPWFCMGNLLALKNVSRFGNPIDHINHWTFGGFKKLIKRLLVNDVSFDKSFPWSIAFYINHEAGDESGHV